MRTVFFASIGLFLTMAFSGCTDKSVTNPDPAPGVFSLEPADQRTDVPRNTSITMTFGKPVDRVNVEENFRLISAKALIDSLCPTGGVHHGTMATAMHDSAIMRHLDMVHGISGKFTWSADGLAATFTPDSVLWHHTQHMIHVPQAMKAMLEERLGDLGTLGQGGMRMPDMNFHFTTGMM